MPARIIVIRHSNRRYWTCEYELHYDDLKITDKTSKSTYLCQLKNSKLQAAERLLWRAFA